MTASTHVKRSPQLVVSPSESLEDIHFNLAQEITRAMATSHDSPSPSTPLLPERLSNRQGNTHAATVETHHHASPQRRQHPTPLPNSPAPIKIHTRAPVIKPSPAEEELVRRIHRKVGGPSKLSTYDDPAKVRHVVIEALALEQSNASDASRIRKGQLSVFERRVVRTVTNRGAAVRSRMRQRKEVAQLKNELRVRDVRVRHLENVVRALCSKYAAPLPEMLVASPAETPKDHLMSQVDAETEPETDSMKSADTPRANVGGIDAPDFALDQELFGNLVDQMITHPAWC